MSLHYQITHLPLIYQIGTGLIERIPEALEEKNLTFKHVLLISGGSFSSGIADRILRVSGCQHWKHCTIFDGSEIEVQELLRVLQRDPIELIVAVGGGKVIDVGKRISLLSRINNLVIPTVISNDGLISPISVLKNAGGRTESLPAQMPLGMLADINILEQCPLRFIQAAAGDVLSNLSATNDWGIAVRKDRERMQDIPYQMARMSADSLLHLQAFPINSVPFLTQLINTQLNSGIAMAVAGSSRPCSGSEHLISHAIDYLDLSRGSLHGFQVGSISLFTMYLQGDLPDFCLEYAKRLPLHLTFEHLSPEIGRALPLIFKTAREMRPGRYTVLDEYRDGDLCEAYEEFNAYLKGTGIFDY